VGAGSSWITKISIRPFSRALVERTMGVLTPRALVWEMEETRTVAAGPLSQFFAGVREQADGLPDGSL